MKIFFMHTRCKIVASEVWGLELKKIRSCYMDEPNLPKCTEYAQFCKTYASVTSWQLGDAGLNWRYALWHRIQPMRV